MRGDDLLFTSMIDQLFSFLLSLVGSRRRFFFRFQYFVFMAELVLWKYVACFFHSLSKQMLTLVLAVLRPRDMTDYTLLPDQSLFPVHDVHEVTGQEALATDYYSLWQAIMEGKQKVKHNSLFCREVVRGLRYGIGCCLLWHTVREKTITWCSLIVCKPP